MKTYKSFQPDLIVEATSVCDRACAGCYAPNLISKFSPIDLYKAKPELFLAPAALEKSLLTLSDAGIKPCTIAIRGGEPSRHPLLSELLTIAHRFAETVFVETHGRWIIENTESNELLDSAEKLRTVFKISFDRMHGLSSAQLTEITARLSNHEWAVAITEKDEKEFLETRAMCAEIPDSKIIFQKKASLLSALIQPTFGIIRIDGKLTRSLSVKNDFIPMVPFAEAMS